MKFNTKNAISLLLAMLLVLSLCPALFSCGNQEQVPLDDRIESNESGDAANESNELGDAADESNEPGVEDEPSIDGGDVWIQTPSTDPAESVRSALENQIKKSYTIKLEIETVEVDEAETVRVVEQYIKGTLASWRGWSDEYLAEHFTVVKAVYHAEYDREKTTRADGDITMYFYLAQDVDTGEWEIVDNSGNTNRPETDPELEGKRIEDQIFAYLSGLYDEVYSRYYDGLHYEMSRYKETIEGNTVTAVFLWTMYFLDNGWDVQDWTGVEQKANSDIKVTAEINEDGTLDLDTIAAFFELQVSPLYPGTSTPIEETFPKQLAD